MPRQTKKITTISADVAGPALCNPNDLSQQINNLVDKICAQSAQMGTYLPHLAGGSACFIFFARLFF